MTTVVGVRVHCDACHTPAIFTGPDCQATTRLFTTSHYLPVIDEVDVLDPSGTVLTMRRCV